MAEKIKGGGAERLARTLRNVHVVGALALAGAAVLAPPAAAVAFTGLAATGAVGAGGFEVARRMARKKRQE